MAFPTPYSSILLCNPTISHDSLHSFPHRSCFQRRLDRVHGHGDATSTMARISPLPRERALSRGTPRDNLSSDKEESVEPKAPPPSPNSSLIQRQQSSKQQKALAAASIYHADAAFFQPLLNDPIESQIAPQESPRSTSSSSSRDYTFDTFLGQTSDGSPTPSAFAKERAPWPLRDSSPANVSQHRKAQSLPLETISPQTPCGRRSRPTQNRSLDLNICLNSSHILSNGSSYRPFTSPLQSSPTIQRKQLPINSSPPPIRPTPNSARGKPRSLATPTPLRLFPPSPTSTLNSTRSAPYPYSGPDQLSPISSTFRPSLQLQTPQPQMISVFEDDDEKVGLIDYVRFPLKRRITRARLHKPKYRTCSGKWKKAFCYFCEDSDDE